MHACCTSPISRLSFKAFARAAGAKLLCLAHVTKSMGQGGADFGKGEADGTTDAIKILERVVGVLSHTIDTRAGDRCCTFCIATPVLELSTGSPLPFAVPSRGTRRSTRLSLEGLRRNLQEHFITLSERL